MAPFTNSARSDDLVLRHWQKKREPAAQEPEMETDEKEDSTLAKPSEEYPFAKYNVKTRVPRRYTDEEYAARLQSDEWSRQETDYLMDLVEEFDLRWVVIADRYDYQPQQPTETPETATTALVPSNQQPRTMEQMKARYYSVAATMLALEHPPSEMSETEFDLHEKMLKFDASRETSRKELASLQLNRTPDEVREEAILLEELKRITASEQAFITDRKELYSRLQVPVSVGNTTMYQSSQGLGQLLQTLLQQDKSKKRRSLLGPGAGGVGGPDMPSPANALPRDVLDTPTSSTAPSTSYGGPKKSTQAQQPPPQTLKPLTPAEETKYGIQHHDRLTPSVQFRSDKAQKLTQAKSNVQTQKLASALAELEVPLRLVMPTERVCKSFEKLIQGVNLLLDARKVGEKVESEIRVLEAAKEERERREGLTGVGEGGGGGGEGEGEKKDEKEKEDQNPNQNPVKVEGGNENEKDSHPQPGSETAPPAPEPTETEPGAAPAPDQKQEPGQDAASSHKRSASVLSNASDKSAKRQRK